MMTSLSGRSVMITVASKAAMPGFMRTAAIELASSGITINAILSANIATEGLDELDSDYLKNMIAYNLDSGDVVFKYTGGDKWSQDQWNFKQILSSNKNMKLQLY